MSHQAITCRKVGCSVPFTGNKDDNHTSTHHGRGKDEKEDVNFNTQFGFRCSQLLRRSKARDEPVKGILKRIKMGIFDLVPCRLSSWRREDHSSCFQRPTHHFQTDYDAATVQSSKGVSTEHDGGSIEERPDGASGKLRHVFVL
jgi:hypothetical protein